MDFARLAIALALPWAAASAWLLCLLKSSPTRSLPLVMGYGFVLGILLVTLALRLADFIGRGFGFYPVLVGCTALLVAAVWFYRRTAPANATVQQPPPSRSPSLWSQVFFSVLLALVAMRLAGLALEVSLRPLYAWDSWMSWGVRARVYFEQHALASFVFPQSWWEQPTDNVYHVAGANHPPTIPLIQTWMALAIGRWDDVLVNVPWLFCLIALLLAFYGQARTWGISPLPAMVFVYLVASLPMLGVHVALAGYADIWLTTIYTLGGMAVLQWCRDSAKPQLVLALLLLPAQLLIKKSALITLVTLLPPIVFGVAKNYAFWLFAVLLSAAAVALGYWQFAAADRAWSQLLDQLEHASLGYLGMLREPNLALQWNAFFKNLIEFSNFHLAWLVAAATSGLALWHIARIRSQPLYGIAGLLVVAQLVAYFVGFILSDSDKHLDEFTNINRVAMFFLPLLFFCSMVMLNKHLPSFRAN